MALPSTNISLLTLKNAFGGVLPISFSDYYKDATSKYTTSITTLPTKGNPISLYNFIGITSTLIFYYTGANQTLTIPSNCSKIYVKMWGAGGAGYQVKGGNGGYVSGYISVVAGDILTIKVGGGGIYNASNAVSGGYPDGGATVVGNSASGGGSSSIFKNSNADASILAGGGGGGGSAKSDYFLGNLFGGCGGNKEGNPGSLEKSYVFGGWQNINNGTGHFSGGGGTQTSGGLGGQNCSYWFYQQAKFISSAGSKYQGGYVNQGGGGAGGGGYYGGGGGGFGDGGPCAGGGGSSYIGGCDNLIYYNILKIKKPWGMYYAGDWDSNNPSVFPESFGHTNRNATVSGTAITKNSSSGNGATASITYISGTSSSYIRWTDGSIPANFTVCTLTRYTGGSYGRILTSTDLNKSNWLHGHHDGRRGCCHYNRWITPYQNNGTLTDWLNCCAENNSKAPYNALIDNTAIGNADGGTGQGTYSRLTINYFDNSNWSISYVIIWDQVLSDADFALVSTILQTYLNDGIPIMTKINNNTSNYDIFTRIKPWGMYFAGDWNSNNPTILPESFGYINRNAIFDGETVTSGTSSGNGATCNISYVSGTTATSAAWPSGSLPNNFTICTISRYTGGANGRIFNSTSGDYNWLHGHWNGNRAVCYYTAWMTEPYNTNSLYDWLNCCGKNNSTAPNNILMNTVPVGNNNNGSGYGAPSQLGVNVNEYSDWALSYIIIWDQVLLKDELINISMMLQQYLLDGIPILTKLNNNTNTIMLNSVNSYDPPNITDTDYQTSIASGGAAYSNGNNGLVVIRYVS